MVLFFVVIASIFVESVSSSFLQVVPRSWTHDKRLFWAESDGDLSRLELVDIVFDESGKD